MRLPWNRFREVITRIRPTPRSRGQEVMKPPPHLRRIGDWSNAIRITVRPWLNWAFNRRQMCDEVPHRDRNIGVIWTTHTRRPIDITSPENIIHVRIEIKPARSNQLKYRSRSDSLTHRPDVQRADWRHRHPIASYPPRIRKYGPLPSYRSDAASTHLLRIGKLLELGFHRYRQRRCVAHESIVLLVGPHTSRYTHHRHPGQCTEHDLSSSRRTHVVRSRLARDLYARVKQHRSGGVLPIRIECTYVRSTSQVCMMQPHEGPAPTVTDRRPATLCRACAAIARRRTATVASDALVSLRTT